MFIVPTRSRFRSQTTADTPRAISRGGKSCEEMRTLGERMRYQDRELSAKDVASLSADEFLWFEIFFPQRISDAAQIEANKRHYKETKPQMDARRMWSGSATEDECVAAEKAGDDFAHRYPAFVRHSENAKRIASCMQSHDLDATKVESYAEAFANLSLQGLIHLSPKNAGVGPEGRLTDPTEIRSYPKLHLLVQPTRVLKPEDKLSADEYRKLNPDLFGDNDIPYLIQKRMGKKQATDEHLKRSELATDRSGCVTNLTDYKQNGK